MKSETKKQYLSKKIVVPVVALGVIAIATLSSANMVSAQYGAQDETLVDRIATKFGLNKTEVEETFQDFRIERGQERHRKMGEMLETKLEEAVETGSLTSDQMYAVLQKHEELEARHDDLYDLSPEDAREARADIHEEMEAWALENDIDMDVFMRFGGGPNGEGKGLGTGEGQGQGGMRMHRF